MHLGVVSWGLALHIMSQVITIFGLVRLHQQAVGISKSAVGSRSFFRFFFLLFGIALEEVGGDGPWVSAILAERDDLIEEKKVVLEE